MLKRLLIYISILFTIVGCASTEITSSSKLSKSIEKNSSIAIFTFENYTDTPQAGERASNLADGILRAEGFSTVNNIDKKIKSFNKQKILAKKEQCRYILRAGVSEWRYKTGIDGEPAVSLSLNIIDLKNNKIVWSATGSDSRWGNASLGTTAQGLLKTLLK